jgi:hypothetical protein
MNRQSLLITQSYNGGDMLLSIIELKDMIIIAQKGREG